MITQMKKVSIVLLDEDKQNSLTSLKKLGIMHLKENFGSNENVKTIEEKIKDVNLAIRLIDDKVSPISEKFNKKNTIAIIQNIINLGKEISTLEENSVKIKKDIESLDPWGDFNPKDLEFLEKKGIKINLVEVSKDKMKTLTNEINYFRISQTKVGVLVAIVGNLPNHFTAFEPPLISVTEAKKLLDVETLKITTKNSELSKLSVYSEHLLIYKSLLEDKLEFEQVKAGMAFDSKFSVLEGWIASNRVENFKVKAAKNKWGIIISDPIEGDDTPTLLKGNKLTSIIHPLLDFLGNVPGYWEQDVSAYFLVFFTIFFAMIVGDAGYGLVFLIIAGIAHFKMKKLNNVLSLFYLISTATVIWGAITGSWFGSNLIKGIPLFNGFVLSQLDTDQEIMELCFHIAVVHIVLARIAAFRKSFNDNDPSSFASLGWLTMTLGLLFIVKNLVISSTDYPIPTYSLVAIAIGFVVVIIFGNQEKGKSFIKGIGISLAFSPLTALDTVGAFGDIISYVRLYAVGLAGFAVAQSFNGMAAPLIASGGAGYIGGILILLGGHAFNIAMAALSVLVHGVRLNVLEFSSAADVNWTGKKFNPFREKELI